MINENKYWSWFIRNNKINYTQKNSYRIPGLSLDCHPQSLYANRDNVCKSLHDSTPWLQREFYSSHPKILFYKHGMHT